MLNIAKYLKPVNAFHLRLTSRQTALHVGGGDIIGGHAYFDLRDIFTSRVAKLVEHIRWLRSYPGVAMDVRKVCFVDLYDPRINVIPKFIEGLSLFVNLRTLRVDGKDESEAPIHLDLIMRNLHALKLETFIFCRAAIYDADVLATFIVRRKDTLRYAKLLRVRMEDKDSWLSTLSTIGQLSPKASLHIAAPSVSTDPQTIGFQIPSNDPGSHSVRIFKRLDGM